MIADMITNKKVIPTVTELFTGGRKLNNSLVFNTKFYFILFFIFIFQKNIRLNSTHYFVLKIQQEL